MHNNERAPKKQKDARLSYTVH